MCVPWLIHTDLRTLRSLAPRYDLRDMTLRSYVWHDSFIWVIWHIHDSFICVTWLIYMCDMTHLAPMCDLGAKKCSVRRSIWMSHGTHINESCHTYVDDIYVCDTHEWVKVDLYDWVIHVAWLFHLCDMTNWYVWHDTFICVKRLIRMCDTTYSYVWYKVLQHTCDTPHPYVWHDAFIRAIWSPTAYVWHATHTGPYMWHDALYVCTYGPVCVTRRATWSPTTSTCVCMRDLHMCVYVTYICVTRFSHICDMMRSYVSHDSFMCDMAHSYVWNDSFICVAWLIHMCDMTDSYVWHGSFICVTRLIHTCDMTYSYVWNDWFMCVTWLIHMSDMTH